MGKVVGAGVRVTVGRGGRVGVKVAMAVWGVGDGVAGRVGIK